MDYCSSIIRPSSPTSGVTDETDSVIQRVRDLERKFAAFSAPCPMPLSLAVSKDDQGEVKEILNRAPFLIDQKITERYTALAVFARRKNREMVAFILEKGPSEQTIDNALSESGSDEIAEMLRRYVFSKSSSPEPIEGHEIVMDAGESDAAFENKTIQLFQQLLSQSPDKQAIAKDYWNCAKIRSLAAGYLSFPSKTERSLLANMFFSWLGR